MEDSRATEETFSLGCVEPSIPTYKRIGFISVALLNYIKHGKNTEYHCLCYIYNIEERISENITNIKIWRLILINPLLPRTNALG